MKRHLLILLLVASTIAVCAQPKSPRPPKEPPHHEEGRIEKILTDLTATQKTRIDLVTRETAKKVEKLRKELNNVRDSIKTYMDSLPGLKATHRLFEAISVHGAGRTLRKYSEGLPRIRIHDLRTPGSVLPTEGDLELRMKVLAQVHQVRTPALRDEGERSVVAEHE